MLQFHGIWRKKNFFGRSTSGHAPMYQIWCFKISHSVKHSQPGPTVKLVVAKFQKISHCVKHSQPGPTAKFVVAYL